MPPEPKPVGERVGFEPTVRVDRTPDFESGAFDHSATFPISLSLLPDASARRFYGSGDKSTTGRNYAGRIRTYSRPEKRTALPVNRRAPTRRPARRATL